MFDTELETRYGETMRDCDIEAARTIAAEMEKLASTARYMLTINRKNFDSANPNFNRAKKNISRVQSLHELASDELESLRECYFAQFVEFDDDGEMIDYTPYIDFSKQSILEGRASEYELDTYKTIEQAENELADAVKSLGIVA